MPSVRRSVVPLAGTALLAAALVAPSSGAEPAPGGFMSPNVTWVATIPLDAPGIGGRVLTVDGQRRFYVTGSKGLTIYDVSSPALPVVLGTLPLPHFENESVAVSDDGDTVIVASDPLAGPLTYVIDTSLVHAPTLASVIPQGSHTVTCANVACSHLYGSAGWTYDITDRTAPVAVVPGWGQYTGWWSAHYLSRDAAGYLSTGYGLIDPRTDPARPTRINAGTAGWHNSLRPYADQYVPRAAGDTSPALRPGELHIGGGETWGANQCGQHTAGVESWSMVNFDKGVKAKKVDEIKPVRGTWVDGNPAANVGGCSSHWFDYRDGMVAGGWYDHGVRFLAVNEQTGDLTLAGWYQPVATESWAAYWVDDEHVYSVDAVRGIDILRFDRSASAPAPAAAAESWRPIEFPASDATRREQALCRFYAPDGTLAS